MLVSVFFLDGIGKTCEHVKRQWKKYVYKSKGIYIFVLNFDLYTFIYSVYVLCVHDNLLWKHEEECFLKKGVGKKDEIFDSVIFISVYLHYSLKVCYIVNIRY